MISPQNHNNYQLCLPINVTCESKIKINSNEEELYLLWPNYTYKPVFPCRYQTITMHSALRYFAKIFNLHLAVFGDSEVRVTAILLKNFN